MEAVLTFLIFGAVGMILFIIGLLLLIRTKSFIRKSFPKPKIKISEAITKERIPFTS
jgi:membrane-bound ClpP family serine protease